MKQRIMNEDETTETVVVRGKRASGSKLKKKIVYVYDSDSDDEKYKRPVAGMPTINSPPPVA